MNLRNTKLNKLCVGLSMILAITMVMSMMTFTAFAAAVNATITYAPGDATIEIAVSDANSWVSLLIYDAAGEATDAVIMEQVDAAAGVAAFSIDVDLLTAGTTYTVLVGGDGFTAYSEDITVLNPSIVSYELSADAASVEFGTASDAIAFPTVTATIDGLNTTEAIAVTWACADYDANAAGDYVFTVESVNAAYPFADGVQAALEAETFTVTVLEAVKIVDFAVNGFIYSGFTVLPDADLEVSYDIAAAGYDTTGYQYGYRIYGIDEATAPEVTNFADQAMFRGTAPDVEGRYYIEFVVADADDTVIAAKQVKFWVNTELVTLSKPSINGIAENNIRIGNGDSMTLATTLKGKADPADTYYYEYGTVAITGDIEADVAEALNNATYPAKRLTEKTITAPATGSGKYAAYVGVKGDISNAAASARRPFVLAATKFATYITRGTGYDASGYLAYGDNANFNVIVKGTTEKDIKLGFAVARNNTQIASSVVNSVNADVAAEMSAKTRNDVYVVDGALGSGSYTMPWSEIEKALALGETNSLGNFKYVFYVYVFEGDSTTPSGIACINARIWHQ